MIEDAPTPESAQSRADAVDGLARSVEVSVADACGLYEKASRLIADLEPRDARAVRTAADLRDAADVLRSLSSAGGRVRRRAAGACDALAAELAAELVKRAGPLRDAVAYLLSHPPEEPI